MNEWHTYAGRLLWAMRRAGKVNQSELARTIGVKPQSIQYLCDPDSGAQGSTHTPALARELSVDADWLARGMGQPTAPLDLPSALRVESSASPYAVQAAPRAEVSGAYRIDSGDEVHPITPLAREPGGFVLTPLAVSGAHAVRIQGNGLSPYVKDGQFLLLQPAGDEIAPEDNLLIQLHDGRTLIRELIYKRAGSLVVLPVHGGQPEAIELTDIAQLETIACVVPRRWWRANVES